MDNAKQAAINGAIAAMQAADRGESHPRLINYYQRGVDERIRRLDAMPDPVPQSPVTKTTTTEPLGPVNEPAYYGPGGATRSD